MELRIFLSEMQKRHLRSCPLHNVDENSREIELSLGQLGCLAFAVVLDESIAMDLSCFASLTAIGARSLWDHCFPGRTPSAKTTMKENQ